jgi:hypothetical protein
VNIENIPGTPPNILFEFGETIVACDSHVVTVFLEEVILNFHLSETRIVQFSHVVCWTKIIWVITYPLSVCL